MEGVGVETKPTRLEKHRRVRISAAGLPGTTSAFSEMVCGVIDPISELAHTPFESCQTVK